MQKYIWIKTTRDKYEFIVAMGDTCGALAKQLGINKNTIFSAISHAKAQGKKTVYRKVELIDD